MSGTWYDTPFGFLPNLPNADMMQYQREDEGRQATDGGADGGRESLHARPANPRGYGRRPGPDAGRVRTGAGRAPRSPTGAFLEAMKTTGDYEAAQRASQQAFTR